MKSNLAASITAIGNQLEGRASRHGLEQLRAELLWCIARDVRAKGPHDVDDETITKLVAIVTILETLPEEDS